jgi:hypothetical protein
MFKVKRIIASVFIILLVIMGISFNSPAEISKLNTTCNLTVIVSGSGCGDVDVYAQPVGDETVYELTQVNPCEYSIPVPCDEDGTDYNVYVCETDKHGDIVVKVITPSDKPGNLILIPGQCSTAN